MLPAFDTDDILKHYNTIMEPFLKFPKKEQIYLFKRAYKNILENPNTPFLEYIKIFREYAQKMYEMTDTDMDEETFIRAVVEDFFPEINTCYNYNIRCRIAKIQEKRKPGEEVANIKPSYFEGIHDLPGGITPVEFVMAAQKLNILQRFQITDAIRFLRKKYYDLDYIFRYSANPVVNGDLAYPVIGNSYMCLKYRLGEARCSLKSIDPMAKSVLSRDVKIMHNLTKSQSINGKRVITAKSLIKIHNQHPLTEEDTITNLYSRLNNTMEVIRGLYQKGYNYQYQTDLYNTELERLYGICGPLYAKLCEKLDGNDHALLQRLIEQICGRASLIFRMIIMCQVDHSYFATIPSSFLNDLRKPEIIRFPSSKEFAKILCPCIIFHQCIPFLELILNKYFSNERYRNIADLVGRNMTFFTRSIEYLRRKSFEEVIPQPFAELLYVEIILLDRLTYFANFQSMNQKTPTYNSRMIVFKKILNRIHDSVLLDYHRTMHILQAIYYKDDVIDMSKQLDNMRFFRFIELLYLMQYFVQRIISASLQTEQGILFRIDDQGNVSMFNPINPEQNVVFEFNAKYSVIFTE